MPLFFRLGALTDAIITQHASLAGIAQQLAEIYYIGTHTRGYQPLVT